MASGLVEVSVVSFTDLVVMSGTLEELHTRRGFLLVFSKQARREILIRLPKRRKAF